MKTSHAAVKIGLQNTSQRVNNGSTNLILRNPNQLVVRDYSGIECPGSAAERYGLEDPASQSARVLENADLRSLYDHLIEHGSQSYEEALHVGKLIEEVELIDLQERLSQTDNADIRPVFANLVNGSQSHLRAFSRVLQNQAGETYQPQVMAVDIYQSIVSGTQDTKVTETVNWYIPPHAVRSALRWYPFLVMPGTF